MEGETVEDQVVKGKSGKKEFVGIVKSDKMDKTIVVAVETTTLHPLYKKYVTRTKKVKAHDESNEAKIGDRVRVVECRPISKEKCWKLAAIVEHAK
jgi:small subunit ribosomal protein S17